MRVPSLVLCALLAAAGGGCADNYPEPRTGPTQYATPQAQNLGGNPEVNPPATPPGPEPLPPQYQAEPGPVQVQPAEPVPAPTPPPAVQYQPPRATVQVQPGAPPEQYQPPPQQYQPQPPQYQPPPQQYQPQPPQTYRSPLGVFNPQAITTVWGTIVSVTSESHVPGSKHHIFFAVRTDSGLLTVEAGPAWYLHQQGAVLLPGDGVKLTGAFATAAGRPALIASQVAQGSHVLELRQPSGRPVWWDVGGR